MARELPGTLVFFGWLLMRLSRFLELYTFSKRCIIVVMLLYFGDPIPMQSIHPHLPLDWHNQHIAHWGSAHIDARRDQQREELSGGVETNCANSFLISLDCSFERTTGG